MRQQTGAGCLTGMIAFFSRFMLLIMWISRPVAWNATFDSVILPCLGWFFLPITTMMYVWLIQGLGTIQGVDWVWLFLAFLLDIATVGAAGAANRDRLPAGVPGAMPPSEPPA